MSQHNAPYIPPPPPTPRSAEHAVNQTLGESYSQVRARPAPARLPVLTTDLLRVQGGASVSSTPLSGVSNTPLRFSPSTPIALSPRIPSALNPSVHTTDSRTPKPVMEPYNPRQWSQSRQVSGSQLVFGRAGSSSAIGTREVTGMESMFPQARRRTVPSSRCCVRSIPLCGRQLTRVAFRLHAFSTSALLPGDIRRTQTSVCEFATTRELWLHALTTTGRVGSELTAGTHVAVFPASTCISVIEAQRAICFGFNWTKGTAGWVSRQATCCSRGTTKLYNPCAAICGSASTGGQKSGIDRAATDHQRCC